MDIDRVIDELKAVARAPELSRATISKGAAMAALKSIRANQAITLVPIGRNWPAEAVKMREIAAAGLDNT